MGYNYKVEMYGEILRLSACQNTFDNTIFHSPYGHSLRYRYPISYKNAKKGKPAETVLPLITQKCRSLKIGYGGDISLSEVSQVLRNQIESGYGIISEVVEESDSKITSKAGRCPVFEAAQLMGMDVKDIETNCRATSMRFMDAMVKQLNPNLSYQLTKFRSKADESCEESIVLT